MNPRLLLILVLVLVVIGGAAGAFFFFGGGFGGDEDGGGPRIGGGPPTETPTPLPPTPTEIPVSPIVIAVQNIPRGVEITNEMVDVISFPTEFIPDGGLADLENVIGRIARTDIAREEFILNRRITDDFGSLGNVGSDAAAVLEPGRVAIAIPIDVQTSVAYAIEPGDRVDVIVSMLFVDIDPDFQTISPQAFQFVTTDINIDPDTEQQVITFTIEGEPIQGEFDTRTIQSPALTGVGGQIPVSVLRVPTEDEPRPRLTTQRTVQDAQILWVGEFPRDGVLFRPAPTPTPVITIDPTQAALTPDTGPPPPTPVPPRPNVVTLAVRPQDAVVLTYMAEAKLPLTFALRSARSQSLPPTDPVTLDYLLESYNINVPESLTYSLQPPITSIRELVLGEQISITGDE